MVSIKTICSIALAVLLMGFTSLAMAGGVHNGTVLETVSGGGYTYVEVEENGNKFWAAGPVTSVKKGDKVNFSEQIWMPNFKSKALNRTFDNLLFVAAINQGVAKVSAVKPAKDKVKAAKSAPVFSNKPAKKYTIEDIYLKKEELNGHNVKVTGKVVKVSMNIMGQDWVHIEDGTGFPGSNKIVFRAEAATVKVGDAVTATGRLEIDKDFGMGYFYSVIVEGSSFKK